MNFRQAIIDIDTRIPNNVVVAYKQGKVIECRSISDSSSWVEQCHVDSGGFAPDRFVYRIKPTPTLRPWKAEEVPVGALLRHRTQRFGCAPITTILTVRGAWIGFICASDFKLIDVLSSVINETYEHSLDHGKTWLPCGVITD